MADRKNPYRGINAHLHSYLQQQGNWKVFHNKHIADLAEALDAQLPAGYEVGLTDALQIVEIHPDTGERFRKSPEPDVTIYQTGSTSLAAGAAAVAIPTLILTAEETIQYDPELFFTAVVIYQLVGESSNMKPVTRLELLSPTNKASGGGYFQYIEKRRATIEQGTPLIELDYLHETPTPIHHVPSYPAFGRGAYPYLIAVTDPRPTPDIGQTRVFGFNVDAPLPVIKIPLDGDETLAFDFNAVYQRTFESLNFFSNTRRVNYANPPLNFKSYHPDDQARILAVMERIRQGQAAE